MVYQGPSKACARCKQRHIKCDESRPSCRNCIKRQLPCPGYAPEPGIRFQDETTSTIHQAQQQSRRPAKSRAAKETTQVQRPLPEDIETGAINFFFDNYATLGRGSQSSRGMFELIVPIYAEAAPTSAMAAATSAVALTLTSEWHGRVSEAPLARKHLGKALSLLRSSLNDPVLSLRDDTMMAVLLLKFHDMLVATKNLKDAPEDHINGAIALIRHRGVKTFASTTSQRLLQYVRHTAISCAVQRRTKIDRNSELWIDPDSMLKTPCIDLDWIGIDVANLRASAEVRRLLHMHPMTASLDEKQKRDIKFVRDEAAKLEMRLSVWSDGLSGRWRPINISDPRGVIDQSIIDAGFYGRNCHVYPSAQITNIWNLYRDYCLLILELLLRCSTLLHPNPDPIARRSRLQSSTYATSFQSIVDDLCASVPFLLGNRTAASTIEEFDLQKDNDIKFLKHPDDGRANAENLEMDLFMDEEQRAKSLLAQGPWRLHDNLALVIRFVASEAGEALGPLLRSGQVEWMQEQRKRAMTIQRIEGKGKAVELKAKRSNTSIRSTGSGSSVGPSTLLTSTLPVPTNPYIDASAVIKLSESRSSSPMLGKEITKLKQARKDAQDEGDFIKKFEEAKID